MIERNNEFYFCWTDKSDLRNPEPDLYTVSLKAKPGQSWIKTLLTGTPITAIKCQHETLEENSDRSIVFKVKPGSYIIPMEHVIKALFEKGYDFVANGILKSPLNGITGIALSEQEVVIHEKTPIPTP